MESVQVRDLEVEDLDVVAKLYAQGVLMQVPPGSTASLEELTEIMRMDLELLLEEKRNRLVWLAVENEVVKGIVDFFVEPPQIRIRFLGAIPPGKGIGTILLFHVGQLHFLKNISVITAEVSKSDSRAWSFYFNHLGFEDQGVSTKEPGLTLHHAVIAVQTLLFNIRKRL
jgi:hypothetical protein